jgi:hypothetical protein
MGIRQAVDRLMSVSGPAGLFACYYTSIEIFLSSLLLLSPAIRVFSSSIYIDINTLLDSGVEKIVMLIAELPG